MPNVTAPPPPPGHIHLLNKPEPRWPALFALLSVGLLHYALPDHLSLGPPWLLLVLVSVFIVPTVVTHRLGRHKLNHFFGFVTLGVVTLFVGGSLFRLLQALAQDTPKEQEHALALMLLKSALALWATNVLVFACWYWRLDAGGPHARHVRGAHRQGAILFPQMTMEHVHWRPGFVDYLFVAFNTSTAFSPTDAPVLSRWAKILMMTQSAISLTTLAVLVGRGINVL
jgi:hypothetical protein